MSLPWLRLYTEFASDPKVQILAFEDQRHYVMLLCLKGNGVLDAAAPSEGYRERLVAKALGLDPASASEAKRRLTEGGLIDPAWHPLKWDARQFQSDSSAERVRRFREKSRRNVTVTLQKRPSNAIDQTQNRSDTDKTQSRGDARGEPRAVRSTAARLPGDFELTEGRRFYATQQGIADPLRTFENFRDYWIAASGAKARKHDWDATWRMWCRNERGHPSASKPYKPPRSTAEILAEEEREQQSAH